MHNSRKKILREIDFYCKTSSLLMIDEKGELIIIKCPFTVIALEDVLTYHAGDLIYVDAVKTTPDLLLIYIIQNQALPYFFFCLATS